MYIANIKNNRFNNEHMDYVQNKNEQRPHLIIKIKDTLWAIPFLSNINTYKYNRNEYVLLKTSGTSHTTYKKTSGLLLYKMFPVKQKNILYRKIRSKRERFDKLRLDNELKQRKNEIFAKTNKLLNKKAIEYELSKEEGVKQC